MKSLHFLFKPASSLCNMRCRYCFYSALSAEREIPSYGIMSGETRDKIIDNIFTDINEGDEITFAFQGGEPSLAGLDWYRQFIDRIKNKNKNNILHYAFQTNGLLMDEAWCDFFRKNNFLLGLSIDGGQRFHNRNRLTAAGEGSYNSCMKSKELFDTHKVEYNILCVLTNDIAKEPEKIWRFITDENIRYIQFIPCLEAYDEPEHSGSSVLRPALFSQFYSRLLQWWIIEMERGNYISVKFYDDVVNYFLKGITSSCGIDGRCGIQFVIEGDGGVYPCDFYAWDNFRIGNLTAATPGALFEANAARDFLREKPEAAKICEHCGFLAMCRGGCKRMRNVMYAGAGGNICGLKAFLEKCLAPLELTVKRAMQAVTPISDL